MAQKSLMKFLSRKDGRNTVSDNEGNEKVKQTRLLEFVQARKPEQAKIGEIVSMWKLEDLSSLLVNVSNLLGYLSLKTLIYK